MASLQGNCTSLKHHSTGEACLAWSLYIIRTSTIAKNRHLNIVLQAELYLRTGTYDRPKNTLAIGALATPSFVSPLTRHGMRYLSLKIIYLVGERWVNPLPDEASSEVGTRKKRPASRVFFFLPAFGRGCPSVSAHPANCIRCSSNIAIADHFPSKTFSFKHHLTGEAWPACRAIFSFKHNLTGEAWPACRAILPLNSNTT